MSLRARLLIAMVALVAAGLLGAGVVTYRLFSSFLLQRVDEQLVAAQRPAALALSIGSGPFGDHGDPRIQLPPGTWAVARDPAGKTLAGPIVFGYDLGEVAGPSLPADLPGAAGSHGISERFSAGAADGGAVRYRVLAGALDHATGTLIVAVPLTEAGAAIHRLLVVEGVVGGIVLVAVALLALWLVRVGLRPLEGIGETAGAIAAGDLSRRVEPAEDRTEVGRLGLSLNAMLAQIEAAFEERRASEDRLRRFVADASHELRTPLTSIRGYSELFRRGADSRPEDLAKTMRRIEDEAKRMGVLVDDLLLLARLDQGRPLEREPVDVARVAADAVESARAVEPDRPIDLEVRGSAEVTGDDGRLRQVVDNLLDNARVHTQPGTPVHVSVVRDGDHVVLSVTDEGPGLDPEAAGRVFERFYRGDPARSRATGGAGLGLSIVSAIVESHGGSVTAVPSDAGTAVEVRLPARDATSEAPPQADAGAGPAEDDPDTSEEAAVSGSTAASGSQTEPRS